MQQSFSTLLVSPASSNPRLFQFIYPFFRFYCGISIALGAGLSKIFHKIDPEGPSDWANLAPGVPDWFIQQVAEIGFTFISPVFWAGLAAYGEFIGGILIAIGLFTRLSALQMAFQFFVVAFIWYSEPVPFAMYYQQLLFWSFVLITAQGGGRYSIDHYLHQRRNTRIPFKQGTLAGILLCCTLSATAQTDAPDRERIDFTLTNTSLKNRTLEIRCFDYNERARIGYGCRLPALHSRHDNKPLGTRIYEKKNGTWNLVYVLSAKDRGQKIDLAKRHSLSREQWLQAAYDEQNEQAAAAEKTEKNPDVAVVAEKLGLEMTPLAFAGKSLWGKQVHVRIQLPYLAERSNEGFSRKLSRFKKMHVVYPVGTQIYLCEGPYWNGPVAEKLLYTVTSEQANYLLRL
ncbi:MAG: DoxX family protein [Saprospiraceae bacterium]|nr:DoxX family protein [Saprospiraceae bacterium]